MKTWGASCIFLGSAPNDNSTVVWKLMSATVCQNCFVLKPQSLFIVTPRLHEDDRFRLQFQEGRCCCQMMIPATALNKPLSWYATDANRPRFFFHPRVHVSSDPCGLLSRDACTLRVWARQLFVRSEGPSIPSRTRFIPSLSVKGFLPART